MSPLKEIAPAGRGVDFSRSHPIKNHLRISPERVERARNILDAILLDEQRQRKENKPSHEIRGVALLTFEGPHADTEAYNETRRIRYDLKTISRSDDMWKDAKFITERNGEIIQISYMRL